MKLNKDEILIFAAGIVVGVLAGAAVYFGFNFGIGRFYNLYFKISILITLILYLAIPLVAIIWLLYQTYKKSKKRFWISATLLVLLIIGTIYMADYVFIENFITTIVALADFTAVSFGLYKLYKKSRKWFWAVLMFLVLITAGAMHRIIQYATRSNTVYYDCCSDYGL